MELKIGERIVQLIPIHEKQPFTTIYWALVVCMWSLFLFQLYLCYRERRRYGSSYDMVPHQIKAHMTPAVFQKTRLYSIAKINFQMLSMLYRMVMLTVFVHFRLSNSVLLFNLVVDVPLVLYFILVLENQYGFNNDRLFYDTSIFYHTLMCNVLSTLLSSIVELHYDNLTYVKDNTLRLRLEALATRVNFPPSNIVVQEASYRTKHGNASFLNILFVFKRIYMYDTLIKGYVADSNTNEEEERGLDFDKVEAVVCHELGHWQYMHAAKKIFLVLLPMYFGRWYLIKLVMQMKASLCTDETDAICLLGLGLPILVDVLYTAIVMGFLYKVVSRMHEQEADAYATELGYGEQLKDALIKCSKDDLTFPLSDPWYSEWYKSHPRLIPRLAAIDALINKYR